MIQPSKVVLGLFLLIQSSLAADYQLGYADDNYTDIDYADVEQDRLDNFILAAEGAIKDEWIVVMKQPEGPTLMDMNQQEVEILTEKAAAVFAYDVAGMTESSIRVMDVYNSAIRGFTVSGMTEAEAKKLTLDKRVDFVEQNANVTAAGATWGLDRIDERSLPLEDCYSPFKNRDGSGVTAYILDTGIRTTHDEFRDASGRRRRASWGTNTVGDGKNYDCHGHGTHVAGTVGGRTYGVAKNVNLVAVKVLDCNGDGTKAKTIKGVEWVMTNARGKKATANLSLGGVVSAAQDLAVKNLHNSGVPTVVSAGNNDRNACNYSPAREPAVITVGATESNDKRRSSSNYGSCLDIFAPGGSIKSAGIKSDSDSTTMGGTSMAAPHVCGAVALHLQDGSSASVVEDVIKRQATRDKVRDRGSGSPNLLLYVGKGSPCPAPAPSPPSCISGDTGILTKTNDSVEESITQVRDLQIGDTVRGYDSKMKPAKCKVEAIGSFGTGEVYGNYTSDHFVYNPDSGEVEEHGKTGFKHSTDKYDLIADCPLVEDESGMRFGPMDSDFCGGTMKTLSWVDYLLLHSAILRVIRQSGTFWFQMSSYKDMEMVRKLAPRICKNMLRCMKDHKMCQKLEKASNRFVNKVLTDSVKATALKAFSNIGSRCEMGSVSAIVTSGESVDESLIGTADC